MAVRKKRKPVRKKGGTKRKAKPLSASVKATLKRKAAKSKKYTEKGISLSEDSEVSTSHGDIRTQKGKICFVDFDSTNGSYVNGEKVKPHMYNPLQSGDLLSLGATKMLVTFA